MVIGSGGDDFLSGDGGNDTLLTGSGDNRVNAGSGNDSVTGGSGEDWIDLSAVSPDSANTAAWPFGFGSSITAGERDHTVRLWDLNIDRLIDSAKRLAGRELTATQEQTYSLNSQ